MSQDHLEMLFGLIRLKCGSNDNPTSSQLRGIYKQLLVHNELSSGFTGNCLPIEDIGILHISSYNKKPIDLINATTNANNRVEPINNYQDKREQNSGSIFEFLKRNEYAKNPVILSPFANYVIAYVAGFTVKSLKYSLKCIDCINATIAPKNCTGISNLALIATKSRGKLMYPSQDVIKLCTKAETNIRISLKESGNKILAKKYSEDYFVTHTLAEIGGSQLFNSLDVHDRDQENLETHSARLKEGIVRKYVKTRLGLLEGFLCKTAFDPKNSTRQVFTKLTQQLGY